MAGALAGLLLTLPAQAARAQDDGPRVYQLTPVGAKNVTSFWVAKRGNEAPDGDLVPGSSIDTDILVARYVETFSLAGRQFSPFVILPTGRVQSTIHGTAGDVVNDSSGFGDVQIGGVIGLFGAPALSAKAFAEYRPAATSGLFARVFIPTGAYNRDKPVNFGAGRYAFQVGVPAGLVFGQAFVDPRLTTLELLPAVTFYQDNTHAYGASRISKAAQFSLESHLTHTLAPGRWVSADVLYRKGGETTTDGLPDDNPTDGWSAGLTVATPLGRSASLALTYQHVIERRDDGPDGWFFRTAVIVPLH